LSETVSFIIAKAKSIREILDNEKYEVDVFQREFAWKKKQIEQLLEDLTNKFFTNYEENHDRHEVQNYSKYYLGSIILNLKGNRKSIIDGQQRLTSITLLLMYLNNLQKNNEKKVSVEKLILSEKYGKKSYNIQIDDREDCMKALLDEEYYDSSDKNESVKNLVERFNDIEELFPSELTKKVLPYFIDWLIDNVIFVVIETYSDDDAYKIFETMNDRGLNLTPTEMLKGYLLSNLKTDDEKGALNELWKKRITQLKDLDKTADMEFFQAWLRGKYAETIRQTKKGATDEDFEIIGSQFHSWVKNNHEKIKLDKIISFSDFIKKYFDFYSKQYIKIFNAANNYSKEFEHIYHIENRGLGLAPSLYYPLLLSPIKLDDDEEIINKKLKLVSNYLETFATIRKLNHRSISHSTIRVRMYNLIKEIRDKSVEELKQIFKKSIQNLDEGLEGILEYILEKQNKSFVKFLLARITSHIEEKCGITTSFEQYVLRERKNRYEIEHIWADKFEEHKDEFSEQSKFDEYRNSLGGLILIPRGINQSYGALPYKKKLEHYYAQNLLAKSLYSKCYEKNPSFLRYAKESGLPFKPYEEFNKNSIDERQDLYMKICQEIWDPKN